MALETIDLVAKFAQFSDQWAPKTITHINDYDVKIVKVEGEFVWHTHEETDEFFLVIDGRLTIQLRDANVELGPGQLFVVPKGVEHCPVASSEALIMIIEPHGVVNTGDAGGKYTATPTEL